MWSELVCSGSKARVEVREGGEGVEGGGVEGGEGEEEVQEGEGEEGVQRGEGGNKMEGGMGDKVVDDERDR